MASCVQISLEMMSTIDSMSAGVLKSWLPMPYKRQGLCCRVQSCSKARLARPVCILYFLLPSFFINYKYELF